MRLWTNEEKRQYVSRDYPQLRDLYESLEFQKLIPANDLEARVKHLAETVLKLTMTDQDLIMRTATEKGRATALNFLEDFVIAQHKRKVKEIQETIPVPLT